MNGRLTDLARALATVSLWALVVAVTGCPGTGAGPAACRGDQDCPLGSRCDPQRLQCVLEPLVDSGRLDAAIVDGRVDAAVGEQHSIDLLASDSDPGPVDGAAQDSTPVDVPVGIDAGHVDAARVDAAQDSGATDAAPLLDAPGLDSLQSDDSSNPSDATNDDASRQDAAVPDTAVADAAAPDTAVDDAAAPDSAVADAAAPDTAAADAAVADAAVADAAVADTAVADTAVGDAATSDALATDIYGADISTAQDANQNADAATAQDAAVDLKPCGTVSTIVDRFDDGIPDPQWGFYSSSGTSTGETAGVLRLSIGAGETGNVGTLSVERASLRGDRLTARLVQGVPGGGGESFLEFKHDDQNYLGVRQQGTQISPFAVVDGLSQSGGISVTAATPVWLQVREDQGWIYFETSADGSDWTELAAMVSPWFVDRGFVHLGARLWMPKIELVLVDFDDLNQSRDLMDWCPASSLQDDFDRAEQGISWIGSENSVCSIGAGNGLLNVRVENLSSRCAAETTTVYDLDEDAIQVQVVERNQSLDVFTGIMLYSRDGLWLEFGFEGSGGVIFVDFPFGPDYSWSFGANNHDWLRLRRAGGSLYFETSGDGLIWVQRWTTTSFPVFDRVVVMLGVKAGSGGGSPTDVTASFDSYNLP